MKYLKYMLSVLVMAVVVGSLPLSAAGKPPSESDIKKVHAALPAKPTVAPLKARRLLILDLCEGYAHGCIPLAGKTFEMMGKKSGAYEAVTFTDMSAFDAANLAGFDAVLFNNNTKLSFENPAHRKALMDFVKSGKGIIGIHGASDNFYTWPEAEEMMGGQFDGHPWTSGGTWAVKLDDPSHPVNKGFAGRNFSIRDEIYQIKGSYSRNTHHVLLSIDMSQAVNRKVKGIKRKDNDFAIAWIKRCGKGRVFYSSLGHNNAVYWNPAVLQHYLDGIQYALGDLKADDAPSGEIKQKSNYEHVLSYEFGSDKTALGEITASIMGASPAELAEIEANLVKVLSNPSATAAGKQFVCRMLRRCGTEASVPALATLLTDKELSHMARFALQGIESPKVDVALRAALSQVDQQLALGMIDSLGQRRDAQAVPALANLLSSQDQTLAGASAIALGRIGIPTAAKALNSISPSVNGIPVADALLTAAEYMAVEGNGAEAMSIYKKFYNDKQPLWVQIAALRGLVLTEKEKSLPLLVNLLKGSNADLKKQAVGIISELPAGIEITKAIAKPLPTLTSDIQVVLIGALAVRADSVALATIIAATKSANAETKIVALRALGVLNDSSSLPVLLNALRDTDEISSAAAESLSRMNNPEISSLLISALKKSDSAGARCHIIEILTTRSDKTALPSYIISMEDSDAKVSKAAIKALGALGGSAEITAMLTVVTSSDNSAQRRNAEKAISMIAMQGKDSDAIARLVANALENADLPVAKSLITILKRTGGQVAMVALQNEIKTGDAARRKVAVRALADWQDVAPAEILLKVAQTEDDASTKILALRGYIGFAAKAGGAKGVEMSRKALDAAIRTEDKKVVLSILGELPDSNALILVEPFLSLPEFQDVAENSYSSIAISIMGADSLAAAVALKKVTTFQNIELAEKAKKNLDKIRAQSAFITTWMLSGPYTKAGVSAKNLIDTLFFPEDPTAKDVKWVPVKEIRNGEVLLEKEFKGNNRVAYLLTELVSDKEQAIRLEMGSDDGIKVWLNRKMVHKNNAARAHKIGDDKANIVLKAGRNRLLVKITQGGGGWSGSVRISKLDGSFAEGVSASILGL